MCLKDSQDRFSTRDRPFVAGTRVVKLQFPNSDRSIAHHDFSSFEFSEVGALNAEIINGKFRNGEETAGALTMTGPTRIAPAFVIHAYLSLSM